MEIIYAPTAQDDIKFWKKTNDKKILSRISALITSIESAPFEGIGKPEALKYEFSGCWSRRITKEHRIVYRLVNKNTVEIISLRFHY